MSNNKILCLTLNLNNELDNKTNDYINQLGQSNSLLKEFNLSDDKNLSDLIQESKSVCGIYYFQIKFSNDIPDGDNKADFLKDEWNKDQRNHIPPIIKKNINNNIKSDEWIPLYIGKCEDVYGRLKQHLIGESTTSSLRLNEIKSGIFKKADYKISILNLDELKKENYWIVSKIEKNIREGLKPICGR